MSQAQPGEILASNTVRDLVPGSGITFDEAPARTPPPAPGANWRVYRVDSSKPATPAAPRPRSTLESSLTRREREVVRLLARGRTNREIADSLVISERTVENHVSNVLSKLNLETRAQVAVWALSSEDARTLASL
jgi:DNA-binding CsgD family transcriptional regulator